MATWKAEHAAARQKLIDDCPRCDDKGFVEAANNSVARCEHTVVAHA
jgi:hypothetical protein